jgi:REP element-mobilizing transposase RayT
MSHSYNKIWIHAIWATKFRAELIDYSFEKDVYNIIYQELVELGCPVRIINGMPDHIHALFLLNPTKSIADVIKQIKGSSSHSINGGNFILEKFAWQTGFAAFSVSESQVERVYNYIKNQKTHHLKQTSQEEFDEYIKLYGLSQD